MPTKGSPQGSESEMEYKPVIGLEVHIQLLTNSKLFCGCSTVFGAFPNSQTCPVCLGLPGVLPVLNRKAVEYGMRLALATGCGISSQCSFSRKNYFYPDLPKGYQITQYEWPLAEDGYLEICLETEKKKRVRIQRIQLEEDAGKSLHPEEGSDLKETLVDLNRCGVPLLEVISYPDMHSPEEARIYLETLRQLVQYLGICDGDLEKGSFRCDVNISLRPKGSEEMGTRTEAKNLNSFKGVERTLRFEISRQREVLRSGKKVVQETLQWDARAQAAFPTRRKEEAYDYRYFPEPDLVWLEIEKDWIERVRKDLPELPAQRRERSITQYGLPANDAQILTSTRQLADYYEECLKLYNKPKIVSNWIMSELLRELNQRKLEIEEFKLRPPELTGLLKLIDQGIISGKMAKEVFIQMAETGQKADSIVEERGLVQVQDEEKISSVIDEVLKEEKENLARYQAGKKGLFGYFVGQVMKKTGGKANPQLVNRILRERLG